MVSNVRQGDVLHCGKHYTGKATLAYINGYIKERTQFPEGTQTEKTIGDTYICGWSSNTNRWRWLCADCAAKAGIIW